MCATVIWAVNRAAFTLDFEEFTSSCLGVAPARSSLGIAADEVRPSAVTFSLTVNGCDCGGLIGRGNAGPLDPGEVSAERFLRWLTSLPDAVEHVTTLAVARAWSPAGDLVPETILRVPIQAVDETALRHVGDESLLVISYPRVA